MKRRFILLAAVLLGACAGTQEAVVPTIRPASAAQEDSDYSTDGAPLERDPPSLEEIAKGHTFRDIYKPVALTCDEYKEQIRIAQGACALNLWVDQCGEKDADGHPTGKYRNEDCPKCETLTSIENRATAAGCNG